MSEQGTGPLRQVLDAFEAGAASLAQIGAQTGLDNEAVRAAVDHLVRSGRLEAKQLAAGCPSGGCGNCASAGLDGRPGCGAVGPSVQRSGPTLVQLTVCRD